MSDRDVKAEGAGVAAGADIHNAGPLAGRDLEDRSQHQNQNVSVTAGDTAAWLASLEDRLNSFMRDVRTEMVRSEDTFTDIVQKLADDTRGDMIKIEASFGEIMRIAQEAQDLARSANRVAVDEIGARARQMAKIVYGNGEPGVDQRLKALEGALEGGLTDDLTERIDQLREADFISEQHMRQEIDAVQDHCAATIAQVQRDIHSEIVKLYEDMTDSRENYRQLLHTTIGVILFLGAILLLGAGAGLLALVLKGAGAL